MPRRMSIFLPLRDYPPHPAPGIAGVAVPAGNEVDVGVKDRLAGARAAVDADVEAGDGRVFGLEFFAQGKDQGLSVAALPGGQREPVGGVALGDDEQVACGDRKAVVQGEHGAAFGHDALPDLRGAERAVGVLHGLSRNFLQGHGKDAEFFGQIRDVSL